MQMSDKKYSLISQHFQVFEKKLVSNTGIYIFQIFLVSTQYAFELAKIYDKHRNIWSNNIYFRPCRIVKHKQVLYKTVFEF